MRLASNLRSSSAFKKSRLYALGKAPRHRARKPIEPCLELVVSTLVVCPTRIATPRDDPVKRLRSWRQRPKRNAVCELAVTQRAVWLSLESELVSTAGARTCDAIFAIPLLPTLTAPVRVVGYGITFD